MLPLHHLNAVLIDGVKFDVYIYFYLCKHQSLHHQLKLKQAMAGSSTVEIVYMIDDCPT